MWNGSRKSVPANPCISAEKNKRVATNPYVQIHTNSVIHTKEHKVSSYTLPSKSTQKNIHIYPFKSIQIHLHILSQIHLTKRT